MQSTLRLSEGVKNLGMIQIEETTQAAGSSFMSHVVDSEELIVGRVIEKDGDGILVVTEEAELLLFEFGVMRG